MLNKCVHCETVFVRYTVHFFAGHCPMSDTNIQVWLGGKMLFYQWQANFKKLRKLAQ